MHKLSRGAPPLSLTTYDYKIKKWSDYILIDENKKDIWDGLFSMQGQRCAYCECELLTPRKGHVEHFQQRCKYPQLTFEWNNLFGSCRRKDGCGFYKDNQKYTQGDILKFDEDDPDNFYDFLVDGSIIIKQNLTCQETHKARETLRVLNLDAEHGSLRQQRSSAIKLYSNLIQELTNYFEVYGYDDLFEELLNDSLSAIKGVPFETAIRHRLF